MGITHDEVIEAVPGLLHYARALTRDPAAAEDLVQDTVVRALERAEDFRGDSAPATWLHRILHHRFVDLARAHRADPTDEDVLAERVEAAWRSDDYTVDAQTVLERAEDGAQLRDALVHLPASYRSAIVLHDVQGLTAAQVADVQDVSVAAAKQRISRGRAMLVSELARETQRRVALKGVPMRCWDARSRVGDYLDDELSRPERSQLESHLSACPTCPALYAGLVGVRAALGALRDPDSVVPPAIARRLRK
ncbi:MAG: sigma-70 family RNA polymerase sigma factor [Dermatophilaceae bacterium]